jgi:hypothetical protein
MKQNVPDLTKRGFSRNVLLDIVYNYVVIKNNFSMFVNYDRYNGQNGFVYYKHITTAFADIENKFIE